MLSEENEKRIRDEVKWFDEYEHVSANFVEYCEELLAELDSLRQERDTLQKQLTEIHETCLCAEADLFGKHLNTAAMLTWLRQIKRQTKSEKAGGSPIEDPNIRS